MIGRRTLLTAGAAMLIGRAAAVPPPPDFSLRGSREQGALMVGKALLPGAQVIVDGKPVRVSPQGWFAFGIAYDRSAPIEYALITPAGDRENNRIEPIKRQYDIQAINGLPEKYVAPPPDLAERMQREHAAIAAARQIDSDGIGFAEPFDWPFPGRLSGVYGSQRILNGVAMAPHLGVDIAAPAGTAIHAPADGIVSIADDYYLEGGFTMLDHGHGVFSCYLHQSERRVKAGDAVRRGDVIGLVGMTGRATGPHSHWGLNWFELKLDPSRAAATLQPPSV